MLQLPKILTITRRGDAINDWTPIRGRKFSCTNVAAVIFRYEVNTFHAIKGTKDEAILISPHQFIINTQKYFNRGDVLIYKIKFFQTFHILCNNVSTSKNAKLSLFKNSMLVAMAVSLKTKKRPMETHRTPLKLSRFTKLSVLSRFSRKKQAKWRLASWALSNIFYLLLI